MNIELIKNEVRSENGFYSVYDVIKLCGKKNPRDTWKSLVAEYPEVVGKTDNLKFKGKGQRETPVADKKTMLEIIGLLPGAIGKKYREDAAQLMIEYLDNPEALASRAIDKLGQQGEVEKLNKLSQRAKSIVGRKQLTDTIQSHVDKPKNLGKIIAYSTANTNRAILGSDVAQIKQERGLAKNANIRDSITSQELDQIMFAESLITSKIKSDDIRNWDIPPTAKDISLKVAEFVRSI